MSYAIVEFLATKEVEIVPGSWVSNTQCRWPDHVKAEKASRMVKKQTPPQESWKCFEISLKGLFGTYMFQQAGFSCKAYEYLSFLRVQVPMIMHEKTWIVASSTRTWVVTLKCFQGSDAEGHRRNGQTLIQMPAGQKKPRLLGKIQQHSLPFQKIFLNVIWIYHHCLPDTPMPDLFHGFLCISHSSLQFLCGEMHWYEVFMIGTHLP